MSMTYGGVAACIRVPPASHMMPYVTAIMQHTLVEHLKVHSVIVQVVTRTLQYSFVCCITCSGQLIGPIVDVRLVHIGTPWGL